MQTEVDPRQIMALFPDVLPAGGFPSIRHPVQVFRISEDNLLKVHLIGRACFFVLCCVVLWCAAHRMHARTFCLLSGAVCTHPLFGAFAQ